MSIAANALPSLSDLSYAEHFLVWTLRRYAVGRTTCPLVDREFADACGAKADDARLGFGWFVAELARTGRRRLRLGPPGWPGTTLDEQLVLAAFSAAQHHHMHRLDAHLAWIFGGDCEPSVSAAITVVAMALGLNGHALPQPQPQAVARPVIDHPALLVAAGGD